MRPLLFVVLVGCSSGTGDDVVGPFTGDVHRFVVDAIAIPHDTAESQRFAADLDGDGEPENQFGLVTGVLASTSDLTTNAADMILAGSLASSIEIRADDLRDDATVGVRYLGADDDTAIAVGGRLVAGAFHSNRTRDTRVPGSALIRLPVYTNADPLAILLEGIEIDLEPDGAGGFDGIIRGGFREEAARAAAYSGLVQMIATEPERHLVFSRIIDADRDGVITRAEVDESVIALLVTADIQLFDGTRYAPVASSTAPDSLSLGFGVHLSPCESGRCQSGAPVDRCRDRLRDGDETDVDCGGSCQRCADAASCAVPADCQTGACDANHCRAASCSDTIRDGLESDVDCGGVCGVCQLGQACAAMGDCATGKCSNGVGSVGSCVTP